MDMKRFWNTVRAEKEKISEEWPLVISIEDDVRQAKGGTIFEVHRDLAAKLIVEKSHRLCTPAEANDWRKKEEQKRQTALQEQSIRTLARQIAQETQPPAPQFAPPVSDDSSQPPAEAKGKK